MYVKRDAPLHEFDVGIFYVDGDVYCKQWCRDYAALCACCRRIRSGRTQISSCAARRADAAWCASGG
ncbi:MAG: hypothetical protein V8S72_03230 [Oscillospiraceae bacterium]